MNIHVLVDSVALRLIRRAARNAPGALAERLQEEWLAHLSEHPPGFPRLRFALGCCWAASVIRDERVADAIPASTSTLSTGVSRAAAYTRSGYALRPVRRTDNTPRAALCDINTTPLIDVMLVLLVTLIVALPLMTHAVKLDLPVAPTAPPRLRAECATRAARDR